ncbi:hypothetical protein V8C86DRAFT_2592172 [Haematococcus lacustris]
MPHVARLLCASALVLTLALAVAAAPACPAGQPQVACFADPCSVSPNAKNPDLVCTSNYCGGCNCNCCTKPGARCKASTAFPCCKGSSCVPTACTTGIPPSCVSYCSPVSGPKSSG